MCDQISLPRKIHDIAKQLFKRVEDEKLLRGKSSSAVIAACIFIACRQAKVPRTFKEICQLTRVPKKAIGQCFKTLELAFETSSTGTAHLTGGHGSAAVSTIAMTTTTAEELMSRFCNRELGSTVLIYSSRLTSWSTLPTDLNLTKYTELHAISIVRTLSELGTLSGRSPISIAATTIWFATMLFDEPRTPKEIGEVAGVSEVTIRLAYKSVYKVKDELIEARWLETGRAVVQRLLRVA